MFIILTEVMISHVCTYTFKLIKLCTLSMCHLLFINYTSVKLFQTDTWLVAILLDSAVPKQPPKGN